jgi:hypothetical protein
VIGSVGSYPCFSVCSLDLSRSDARHPLLTFRLWSDRHWACRRGKQQTPPLSRARTREQGREGEGLAVNFRAKRGLAGGISLSTFEMTDNASWGRRQSRRFFCGARQVLTANAPKPRDSTRSPRASARSISSKMASTTFWRSSAYRCGFWSPRRRARSDLSIQPLKTIGSQAHAANVKASTDVSDTRGKRVKTRPASKDRKTKG